MLTILTTPKPFKGAIKQIQNKALANWKELGAYIILYGDEYGIKKAAKDFDCEHVANVPKSAWGTPLIGPIIRHMFNKQVKETIAYCNTDILFPDDALNAVMQYANERQSALYTGKRQDMDAQGNIRPHKGSGMDYFLYTPYMYDRMPDFILGRGYWDTWLAGYALKNWRLVDCSQVITAIHQDHDYSHLPEEAPERGMRDQWHSKGPETEINANLRGKYSATWQDAPTSLIRDEVSGALKEVKNTFSDYVWYGKRKVKRFKGRE